MHRSLWKLRQNRMADGEDGCQRKQNYSNISQNEVQRGILGLYVKAISRGPCVMKAPKSCSSHSAPPHADSPARTQTMPITAWLPRKKTQAG